MLFFAQRPFRSIRTIVDVQVHVVDMLSVEVTELLQTDYVKLFVNDP